MGRPPLWGAVLASANTKLAVAAPHPPPIDTRFQAIGGVGDDASAARCLWLNQLGRIRVGIMMAARRISSSRYSRDGDD
jgi:hypothetical protein